MKTACTIQVERLADGGFRASCPGWPDCEAVAASEEEARRAVEHAIAHQTRRQLDEPPHKSATNKK